ncbi:MAG TPA: FkbM family methyltransferase [Solimonas sp.]
MRPDPIHVACSCDQNYLADAAVMLRSLFVENPDEAFVVHFMYDQRLPLAERDALGALCTEFGHRFAPLLMGEELKDVFPFMGRFGGFNAWYRVLLPHLLPELPKILYLDVDLLIVGRVRELWEWPLDGKCVAAVTNPLFDYMVERVRADLGVPDGDSYFNSGVLLMDLDALRRERAVEQVVAFIQEERAPMPWADQEPLNAVLHARRVRLPPKWNAMPSMWELDWRYLPKSWTDEQRIEARDRPSIVHFLGPYKPWHYRNLSPYRARYFEHLRHTRWKDRARVGATWRNRLIRPLPVTLQWRIDGGRIGPRAIARDLLPKESTLGGLLRDVWRIATPRRPRSPLEMVIEALALTRRDITYVQVGANDATHNDPLRAFTLRHAWRGVLVEPVPYVFERLKHQYAGRAHLTLENVAIAAQEGTADFHCLARSDDPLPPWYDQIGSFSRDNVLKHRDLVPGQPIPDIEQRIVTLQVPCLTFESLCRKHGLGTLDLVHIDTEGYDYEVIKLIDFDAHRPTVVLYEHKHLSPNDRAACRTHLHACGYETLEVGDDTLCLRRDAATLGSRLGRAWLAARRTARAMSAARA